MILVFLGAVAGLEEGRKRIALSCVVLGIPLTCTAGDGKGFVLVGRCMISVVRGGVYHWFRMRIFLRSGWVKSHRVCVHGPASPGSCKGLFGAN